MMRRALSLVFAGSIWCSAAVAQTKPLIDFPTPNHALLAGQPEKFFMYVTRNFEGKKSTPWEGGTYGFVRGPVRQGAGIVYLHHHEGIDIAPVNRDPAGKPIDPIFAAADGTVVYVNEKPSTSNYGKYVVIEHLIEGSRYYSLYAHLGSISAAVGSQVRQGDKIGVMGYTGVGLDRERAHLHFEFALMVSPYFAEWFPADAPRDPNPHGNFNGRNLIGVDPTSLILAARKSPGAFRLGAHLRSAPATFRIVVPNTTAFNLVQRYPWLSDTNTQSAAGAWIIAFSDNGIPMHAVPAERSVASASALDVSALDSMPIARATRGLLGGSAARPTLTSAGVQLARLLTERPPVANAGE
jgi:murein DD-endopeptidase MepM/ murein hydrolase activator NlpD